MKSHEAFQTKRKQREAEEGQDKRKGQIPRTRKTGLAVAGFEDGERGPQPTNSRGL